MNTASRKEEPAGNPEAGKRIQQKRLIQEYKRIQKNVKKLKQRMILERCVFGVIIASLFFLYVKEKVRVSDTVSANPLTEQAPAEEASAPSGKKTHVKSESESNSKNKSNNESNNENNIENEIIPLDYVAKWGMDEVEKPVKRNYRQVLDKLYELAEENALIAQIAKSPEEYPEKLLEALANNPEMADFVKDYPILAGTATGGLTQSEKEQAFPLFLQWDPRWGYASYGDASSIAVSGCGPVSLSMAMYYLTGDDSLTPDLLAAYSMENGYYISGTGTAWSLITDVPPLYGIDVTHPGINEYNMKLALDEGKVLIASMRPGDFTAKGHFLVIYGYDKDGFLVNDPNCVARSRQAWSFDKIGKQIKSLWALGSDTDAGQNFGYFAESNTH